MKISVLVVGAIALAVITVQADAHAAEPLPSYLSGALGRLVSGWLLQHPTYSLMVDADCACADDLREIRTANLGVWRARPDYRPFLATGDFDGDGQADAAVAVTTDHRAFRVLILHGPNARKPYLSPVFTPGQMLFFGAPRPRPWRLIVGPYGIDTPALLVPTHGGNYIVKHSSCC